MSERIIIEIDDAEIEAVIRRLDEAIARHESLKGFPQQRISPTPVESEITLEPILVPVQTRRPPSLEPIEFTAEDLEVKLTPVLSKYEELDQGLRDLLFVQIPLIEQQLSALEQRAAALIAAAPIGDVESKEELVNRMYVRANLILRKSGEIEDVEDVISGIESSPLIGQLPSINRDARLLLGRIPGMRQAMQLLFRIKRLERGMLLGGPHLYLVILASIVQMLMFITSLQEQVTNLEGEYERIIRLATDMTHREYLKFREREGGPYKGMIPF